jgi:hypothetical protein
MRRAAHDDPKPRRLQLRATSLSRPLSQETVRHDAALQEGGELVRHELRQLGAHGCLGFGEEGRGVLLHQALQLGLFRAVPIAVKMGGIRRTLGLPANGSYVRLPKWRTRTVYRRAPRSIALSAACRCVCPPLRGLLQVPVSGSDCQLRGNKIRTADVCSGSGHAGRLPRFIAKSSP